jgi:hypothetical protein
MRDALHAQARQGRQALGKVETDGSGHVAGKLGE